MIRLASLVVAFTLMTIVVSGCGRSTEQQSSESSATPAKPAAPKIIVGPREISGYVFEDKNQNGLFDTGDERLGAQTVLITNPSATKRLHNATTDGSGSFRFGDLPDGEYRVMLMIPEGFYRTNDDSFNLTVLGEQPMQEVHFGIARD